MAIWVVITTMLIDATAQNLNYRTPKNPPAETWQPLSPADTVAAAFAHSDAVILNEKVETKCTETQRSTTVTAYRRIRILTDAGAKKYNQFTIPETFDYTREYADVPLNRQKNIHRPKYFDMTLTSAMARIIKPDGSIRLVSLSDKIETETLAYDANTYRAFAYAFTAERCEKGDILEIYYQYYLPYIIDWQRFFFHGDLPKQNTEVLFTFQSSQIMVIDGVAPSDTTKSTDKRNETTTYIWKYKNLQAAPPQVNSRPYIELPYVTYYWHNHLHGDYQYDNLVKKLPYGWNYIAYDFITFDQRKKQVQTRLLSAKERALNEFFAEQCPAGTGTPAQCLQKINTEFNDNFSYVNVEDCFANIDFRLSKINIGQRQRLLRGINKSYIYSGLFNRLDNFDQLTVESDTKIADGKNMNIPKALKNKELKSANIFAIYDGLLSRLDADYQIVQISDKRVGKIEIERCAPIIGENRLYCLLLSDGKPLYVLPKRGRGGYMMSEVPFYLENTTALRIAQTAKLYTDTSNIRFSLMPFSTSSDNRRTQDVMVQVNTVEKKAKFEAKIRLNGQFSTVLRNYYQYAQKDSSIADYYYKQPYKVSNHTELFSMNIGKPDLSYPYKTELTCVYNDNSLLKQENDTTYVLNLSNWIAHIYPPDFDAKQRTLAYFPDFLQQDVYRYNIVFDRPIKLATFKDLPLHLENEFGICHFDVQQTDSKTVTISSNYKIIGEAIPASRIETVAQMFRLLEKISNASLRFTIK